MLETTREKPVTWLGVWICILGSTFYIYDFFVRIAPSVMTDNLMRDLHTQAFGLGAISSALFLTYTFMQIPAGLLIDHYGVRKPLTLAAVCCSVATFGFAYAHSAFFAAMMFGVIGITAGFSFIAALVLGARWFDAKYFALIVGLVQFMGCVGGIFAEGPLHKATALYGWRHTMAVTAGVGLILALFYFFFLREAPEKDLVIPAKNTAHKLSSDFALVAKRLCLVLKNAQNWWLAGFILCLWTPISIFTSLWGVPAIHAMFNIPSQEAAFLCSSVWIGVAIMGPVWGWWSDWIGRRKLPGILACLFGLVSTALLLLLPSMHEWQIILLLLGFGVAGGGLSMSYALVHDDNGDEVVGTALGFNNMACILGTPIFQPLVSWVLDYVWDGRLIAGAPVYSGENFRVALTSLPLLYLAGLVIMLFFVRETHCHRASA